MKIISLSFLILISFAACEQKAKNESGAATETNALMAKGKGDSLPSSEAMEMIKNLKKIKVEKDSLAFTQFNLADFQKIFCDSSASSISQVRFFIGAMDDDGKGKKIPIVIMQIRRGGSTLIPDYTYEYYKGDPYVCPPPEPCIIEEENKL